MDYHCYVSCKWNQFLITQYKGRIRWRLRYAWKVVLRRRSVMDWEIIGYPWPNEPRFWNNANRDEQPSALAEANTEALDFSDKWLRNFAFVPFYLRDPSFMTYCFSIPTFFIFIWKPLNTVKYRNIEWKVCYLWFLILIITWYLKTGASIAKFWKYLIEFKWSATIRKHQDKEK